MYCSKLKDKRGFSLVEVVIAMALIGIAVYLIPQFLTTYNPRPQTVKRTCESYAQSIISVVQEETAYRDILDWLDNPNTRSTQPTFTAALPRALSTTSDYWNPLASYTITESSAGTQATGTSLQNAALIQGSLRTLAAIYNNNAGVRCPLYGSYTPLTSAASIPVLLQGYSPQVTIKIEPYLISTNASVCDGAFKLPIPQALAQNTSTNVFMQGSSSTDVSSVEASSYASNNAPSYDIAGTATYQIANSSNATQDLGFRLSVRVAYSVEGTAINCEVTQKFEYPTDNTRPAEPDLVRITTNSSLTPSQDNCVAPAAKQTIVEIGYNAAPERGTQLLCRDLSYVQNRMPKNISGVTDYYSGVCIPSGGYSSPPPSASSAGGLNPFPKMTSDSGFPAQSDAPASSRDWDPGYRNFSLRENSWKPCDQLKLCGISATTGGSTYNAFNMRLQYDNVPVGCFMHFEVIGVDTAGNRSHPASSITTPPRMGVFPSTSVTEGRILFPPTCGNSTSCNTAGATCDTLTHGVTGAPLPKVSYDNTYFASGTNSGYYVPRRGVFCKATNNVADDGNLTAVQAEPNSTLFWTTNTVGGTNWRTVFPNGYYTCRGASGFGATGGAGGSGPNGCCWDPPGVTTCTPYN